MTQLFIPFINQFVLNHFQNPWEFFYALGTTRMFPYPPLMLWIMALPRWLFSPLLSSDWQVATHLHQFVMRIPLLLFDLLLYSNFIRLFPTQRKKILAIYWCSPIVFYINYIHGQLDIVPTAIFFSSVCLLTEEKYILAMVALALSAATKTHVFIAVPFIFSFLYRKKISWRFLGLCLLTFLGVYLVSISPYLTSHAFREMVFNSPEQRKLFEFSLPVSSSFNLIVCPAILCLLFLKMASYKKLNREILLMFLGAVFIAMVVFVPAMPGWFMWSLPFFIYFYVSNKHYSRAPFIFYNVVYVLYFLFLFGSPLKGWANTLGPALPIKDLSLCAMLSSALFMGIWMFDLGIRKNEELQISQAPFLIGIAGDSGSGKHTLYRTLRVLTGKSKSIPIFGDDLHKWERGDGNWDVYTHLNPNANNLHQGLDMAVALKDGNPIEVGHYNHTTGRFTDPTLVEPNQFIFFVGLHPFYLKQMREIINLKIFLDTDEELRRYWKSQRDILRRAYPLKKVHEQIAQREADQKTHILPQKDFADLIIQYSSAIPLNSDNPIKKIPLIATYLFENSVIVEPLVDLLKEVKTLNVKHVTTITSHHLSVSGTITPRETMNIAHQFGFNFDELFVNTRYWLKGLKGINQLVFLLIYNHKRKSR